MCTKRAALSAGAAARLGINAPSASLGLQTRATLCVGAAVARAVAVVIVVAETLTEGIDLSDKLALLALVCSLTPLASKCARATSTGLVDAARRRTLFGFKADARYACHRAAARHTEVIPKGRNLVPAARAIRTAHARIRTSCTAGARGFLAAKVAQRSIADKGCSVGRCKRADRRLSHTRSGQAGQCSALKVEPGAVIARCTREAVTKPFTCLWRIAGSRRCNGSLGSLNLLALACARGAHRQAKALRLPGLARKSARLASDIDCAI